MRTAVVVGRARTALDEWRAAVEAFGEFDEVLVVGKLLEEFPGRVDHAVSFHSGLFTKWAAARERLHFPPASCYWGANVAKRRRRGGEPRPIKYIEAVGGSSGFMAVQVALGPEVACDRVVLAGVPMRAQDAHVGSSEPWTEADKYRKTWEERVDWLRPSVRSMSGWTRDLLGAPTAEWITGE